MMKLKGWTLIEGRIPGEPVTTDPATSDVIAALEATHGDMLNPYVVLTAPEIGETCSGFCQALACEDHTYRCEIRLYGRNCREYRHYNIMRPDRMSMGESVVLNPDDPAGFPGIIPTWRPRRSFLPDSDQTQQPCLKSPAGNGWTSPKKLMHSPESLQPIDWEEVRVRADAREWFSERISLITWFWDDEEPGGCQPSLVARSFDSKQPYPQAVRREPPERMSELLRDEWLRAGKPPTGLPKLTPWQDRNGRAAWHIDLGGVPEDQRILVGRALIRMPICGVWDPGKSELAYVGAAKIRYFNSLGSSILEPTDEHIVEQFEEIDPESDAVNNFIVLYRDGRSFIAYIVPEGIVTDVTPQGYAESWRASYPGDGIPVREFKYLGVFREEEIIGHSMATEILMRFLADTSKLPDVSGLIWREVEPDLPVFHKEDLT